MNQQNDEQIKKDVMAHLVWDARVDAANVTVRVDSGNVAIEGTVPTFRSKAAVFDGLSRIRGVRTVSNNLLVEPPTKDIEDRDGQIEDRVSRILDWDSEIDASQIAVRCDNGTVVLDGSTDSLWKKKQAETLVSGVEGVGAVENRLTVVPTDNPDDRKIARDIVAALDRNELAEAQKIDIEVRDGEVTLRGTVPGWLTWRAVCDAVERTPGVRAFRSELAASRVS